MNNDKNLSILHEWSTAAEMTRRKSGKYRNESSWSEYCKIQTEESMRHFFVTKTITLLALDNIISLYFKLLVIAQCQLSISTALLANSK